MSSGRDKRASARGAWPKRTTSRHVMRGPSIKLVCLKPGRSLGMEVIKEMTANLYFQDADCSCGLDGEEAMGWTGLKRIQK